MCASNKCHIRLVVAQDWAHGITWWRVLHITLTPVASTCIINSKVKAPVILEWWFSSASSQLTSLSLHLLLFEEAASRTQLRGSSLTGMFSCHLQWKFCDLRAIMVMIHHCVSIANTVPSYLSFLLRKKSKVSGYKSQKADHLHWQMKQFHSRWLTD